MTVSEFFEKARQAGLRGPARMMTRRWLGTSGQGTFELSMDNGENDLFTAGDFGTHMVTLSFRPHSIDRDGRCHNCDIKGYKFTIE